MALKAEQGSRARCSEVQYSLSHVSVCKVITEVSFILYHLSVKEYVIVWRGFLKWKTLE